MKNPKFLVENRERDQFAFQLIARNGQVLLQSGDYPTLDACREGMRLLRELAPHEQYYQRQHETKGEWSFTMTNDAGEVVATSRTYTRQHGCTRGMTAVRKTAPSAPTQYPEGVLGDAWDEVLASGALAEVGRGERHASGFVSSHVAGVAPHAGMPQPPFGVNDYNATIRAMAAPESPMLVHRSTTLQGHVRGADGGPIAGARITAPGGSAYTQTLSRADGSFILTVHGGRMLPIRYEKPGYLPVQRQLYVHWQEFFWAPDVVLVDARAEREEPSVSASMASSASHV